MHSNYNIHMSIEALSLNISRSLSRPSRYKVCFLTILITFSCGIVLSGCGGGSDADVQYVALGASDATGAGANPITNGYVYLIRDSITSRGTSVNLVNLGIPGAKIHLILEEAKGITRFEQPSLVTIFVGANDLSAGADVTGFQSDLDAMLSHLYSDTDAFIVIGTLPDLTQLPSNIESTSINVTKARVDQFNDAILNEAAKFNAKVADLRLIPNSGDITANDGFHPNNKGYELIAAEFLKIIDAHTFIED